MSAFVTVAFLCNDDDGCFATRTEAVNFVSEEHGNADLTCQMPRGQVLRRVRGEDAILVGRRRFECYGWQEWFGNMAWDATGMKLDEAERLLRYLLACGYTVEGYDCDTGFAAIIEEHEAKAAAPLPGEGTGTP